MDFVGAITTKCAHERKSKNFKSCISIFICMCTKAVDIELVSNLPTEAFLSALQRFISRRSCPTNVYSNNGKNFIGVAAYLKSLFQITKDVSIQDFCSQRQIL